MWSACRLSSFHLGQLPERILPAIAPPTGADGSAECVGVLADPSTVNFCQLPERALPSTRFSQALMAALDVMVCSSTRAPSIFAHCSESILPSTTPLTELVAALGVAVCRPTRALSISASFPKASCHRSCLPQVLMAALNGPASLSTERSPSPPAA